MLIRFWAEIRKRRQTDVNASSYTSAIIADLDQAKAEKRRQLQPEKWLPYNLTEHKGPIIPAGVKALLDQLSDDNILPGKMERDLFQLGLAKPHRKQTQL